MASLTEAASVLKNRQFALLWSGQSVSLLGDGILAVALPLRVLATTGSAADLGLVVALRLLPTVLLLLFGGAVTDRVSRRLAMLSSDGTRAAITAVIGVLALSGHLSFPELLVMVVLFGSFDALFYPASTALIPELVSESQLPAANSLNQVSRNMSGNLFGPIVGGVLASTVGTSWCFVFDSATFVVSASCLLLMAPTPTGEASGNSMLSEIKAGLSFCRRTPWIAWTLVTAGIANAAVFIPGEVLLALMFKRTFHSANWVVGFGYAASGVGGVIGAVAGGVMKVPRRRVRVMWLVWTCASALMLVYGASPGPVVAIAAIACIAPLLMYGNIIWESMLQSEVPRELLGRVSSVDWMISLGLAPIGAAVAGVVAGVVGVRPTIIVPSIAMFIVPLLVLAFVPALTAIDRRPRADPALEASTE